jgi:prepilin-type N-terminal cleavage/methylation domain-containing protein
VDAGKATRRSTAGFTIVELLLATSVFSIILLAALASFLQVGRLFYKGVSLTNTQNTATQVLNDVAHSLQTSSTLSLPTTANGYTYTCIGNARYTYTTTNISGQQVAVAANLSDSPNYGSGANGGNFGLLKDTLPGSSGCAVPCWPASSCSNGQVVFSNPVEMLGDQMRVATFSISSVSGVQNLYNIKMVVAYGDSSVMSFSNPGQPVCIGNSQNQAFCSVVNLSTTVFQGVRS